MFWPLPYVALECVLITLCYSPLLMHGDHQQYGRDPVGGWRSGATRLALMPKIPIPAATHLIPLLSEGWWSLAPFARFSKRWLQAHIHSHELQPVRMLSISCAWQDDAVWAFAVSLKTFLSFLFIIINNSYCTPIVGYRLDSYRYNILCTASYTLPILHKESATG